MQITPEFAERWFAYWRLADGTRAERLALKRGEPATVIAAHVTVDDLVRAGRPDAVAVLVALSENAPEGAARMVAAGPLEDLIAEHGDDLAEAIAGSARRNPRFAAVLRDTTFDVDGLTAPAAAALAPWAG